MKTSAQAMLVVVRGFIVAGFIAAILLTGIEQASAQITTSSDGWTAANFASSCKAAGGRVIEIDEGDIKYSKCVFPDGGFNKCDWIKKTCTFGFMLPTPGRHVDLNSVSTGTLTTADSTPAPTPATRGFHRADLSKAVDDRQP